MTLRSGVGRPLFSETNFCSGSPFTVDRLLSGVGSGSFPGAEGEQTFV
jgi:hypothetical protein